MLSSISFQDVDSPLDYCPVLCFQLRQGGPGMKASAQYPKAFANELLKLQKAHREESCYKCKGCMGSFAALACV